MALQDFNTSREYGIGDVKSRKNIENLSISKEAWKVIIHLNDGTFPVEATDDFTLEELKCVIKLFDSEIESENYFGGCDSSTVKDNREDLVDRLKEMKEAEDDEEDEAEEASD